MDAQSPEFVWLCLVMYLNRKTSQAFVDLLPVPPLLVWGFVVLVTGFNSQEGWGGHGQIQWPYFPPSVKVGLPIIPCWVRVLTLDFT